MVKGGLIIGIVALLLSVVGITITLVLNRGNKPSIMPDNCKAGAGLQLFWKNTSNIVISNLTITIDGFNEKLERLDESISDKYTFDLGEKSVFSYNFGIPKEFNLLLFRVRFNGLYPAKYFWWKMRPYEQVIWHTIQNVGKNDKGNTIFKHFTTHRDEHDQILQKYKSWIIDHDKETDSKFRL